MSITSTELTPAADAAAPSPDAWSPWDTPRPRAFALRMGAWTAEVVLRPWTAAERIAYEDASATTLITTTEAGERTMRAGRLGVIMVTSTVQSWSGFPDTITRATTDAERERTPSLGAEVVESLDLRRPEHVQALPAPVYAELTRLAQLVQPIPGTEGQQEAREAAQRAQDPSQADSEGEQGEDPSPTPPTPSANGHAQPAPSAKGKPARK